MNKAQTLLIAIVFFGVNAFASHVPDTGQNQCYDVFGNLITCPSTGQPFYGQDANYSINPMSYTKLDENGNPLPNSATNWVMVKDNVTGLIWEAKTNKDGIPNYSDPHDADNVYNNKASELINALNSNNFGGFNDWRVPTIEELSNIVDYSIPYPGPAINIMYFQNIQQSDYWSCSYSKLKTYISGYYSMNFQNGAVSNNNITNGSSDVNLYTLAVRGGQLHPPYIDNGDGTITDTLTGLIWQQNISEIAMTWDQALYYCETMIFAGYSDWRLPTIKELLSFNGWWSTYTGWWSSTTATNYTNEAWDVVRYDNFTGKSIGVFIADKNNIYYVPAVRGGEPTQGTCIGQLCELENGVCINGVCVTQNVAADFSASPTTGEAPLNVNFHDESTGYVTDWDWDFGDGQPHSKDVNATSHMYAYSGSYDVTLTVSGPTGTSSITKKQLINVSGGPCQPFIKANGNRFVTTITPITPIYISIGLASGEKNGELADWWLAVNTPWGWEFWTTDGWTYTMIPFYRSISLFDFPDVTVIGGQLPVGEYEFYFGLYLTQGDITDSPIYISAVKVNVIN